MYTQLRIFQHSTDNIDSGDGDGDGNSDIDSGEAGKMDTPKAVSNEDIYKKLCSLENSFERMRGEIHDLAIENEKLREELKRCKAETETAKEIARNAEQETHVNRAKLVELEQYTRRNNVRVFGVTEREGETAKECEEKIVSLVQDKLKINIL